MHRVQPWLRLTSGACVEARLRIALNIFPVQGRRWEEWPRSTTAAACSTCNERRRGLRQLSSPLRARLASNQSGIDVEHGFQDAGAEAGPSFSEHIPHLNHLNQPGTEAKRDEDVDGSTSRIDAYRHLRQHAPSLLSTVSDEGLIALCDEAARNSAGTVVEDLLSDLAPNSDIVAHRHSLHWFQRSDGAFNAPRGSQRRNKALQQLLTSALVTGTPSSSGLRHSWASVQRCMPLMSATNLKRTCQLLVQDLALLNRNTMVDTSTLLRDVHPTAARWLMMTIARNNDVSLVALVTALWQHVETSAGPVGSDFPSHVEGDAMVRYYLSLEDSADDVVIGTLDTKASNSSYYKHDEKTPKSHIIAGMLVDSVNARQTLPLKQSTDEAAVAIADGLGDYLPNEPQDGLSNDREKQRLRMRATMAIVNAHSMDAVSARRCIEDAQQDLDGLKSVRRVITPRYMLVGLTRTVFQILSHGRALSAQSDAALDDLLAIVVGAACSAPSSSGPADLSVVREYCEKHIAQHDYLRAYRTLLTVTDLFDKQEGQMRRNAISVFGGDTIADLAEHLTIQKDSPRMQQLMQSLGLMNTLLHKSKGVHMLDLFSPHQIARLIRASASTHLASFTASLYTACVPAQTGLWTVEKIVNGLESKLDLEATPATAQEKNRQAADASLDAVAHSSKCMVALVNVMTRGEMRRWVKKQSRPGSTVAPVRLQLAYHALFTFMDTKPFAVWEYDDVINFVKALFRLGHDTHALRCLSGLASRKELYTNEALSVLIRGLAQIDLSRAVDLLSEWKDSQRSLASINVTTLTPVAAQILTSNNLALSERFWQIANTPDLQGSLELQAIAALSIATKQPKPGKLKKALGEVMAGAKPSTGGVAATRDEVNTGVQEWQKEFEEHGHRETDILNLWNRLGKMIKARQWTPDPLLFRWMVLRSAAQSNRYYLVQPDPVRCWEYSSMAVRLLYLNAERLGRVDDIAANAVIKTFHSAKHAPSNAADGHKLRARIDELDRVTSAMRWALQYRDQYEDELYLNEMLSGGGDPTADDGDTRVKVRTAEGTLCNSLPAATFRALILAYLRLGDTLGAASVMEWAREECQMSVKQLGEGFDSSKNRQQKSFANVVKNSIYNVRQRSTTEAGNRSDVLSWMSGETSVPRVKRWWYAPIVGQDSWQ